MTVVRLNGTQDKRLGAAHETNTRSQHQDAAAMEWNLSTWLHPEPSQGKPSSTDCSARQLESEVSPAEIQKATWFSGKFPIAWDARPKVSLMVTQSGEGGSREEKRKKERPDPIWQSLWLIPPIPTPTSIPEEKQVLSWISWKINRRDGL